MYIQYELGRSCEVIFIFSLVSVKPVDVKKVFLSPLTLTEYSEKIILGFPFETNIVNAYLNYILSLELFLEVNPHMFW